MGGVLWFAHLTGDLRFGAASDTAGVEFGLGPGDVGVFLGERRCDGALFIVRADPLVFISVQLVREWEMGHVAAGVSYGEHILTIRAVNRTVSYGLIREYKSSGVWLAQKSPEPGVEVS